jgi:hypothetical protein
MFGYVVGEVLYRPTLIRNLNSSQYTGVDKQYLELGAPLPSGQTQSSKYIQKAFKMQTRCLKAQLGRMHEGVCLTCMSSKQN